MHADEYKQLWETRYAGNEYAYGTAPNAFFKAWLPAFTPARILMPADGEGRNGVYAATLGWEVTSFDISSAGSVKALQLARHKQVPLRYLVGTLDELALPPASFDAIGLLYAHVGPQHKEAFHRGLEQLLKPGGIVLFEAFDKTHAAYKAAHPGTMGPADLDMLYSAEELQSYYPGYEPLVLAQEVIAFDEGKYHQGNGSVVRFVGRKPVPLPLT